MSTDDLEQLQATIAALEAQRPLLGKAIVETALAPLRQKLAGLTRTAPPDEERKRVSVLFADLVGFTAMSETLDPEEVHAIMDAYFGAVTPAITRYQGTVEKYIGDAIMAVSGAPQAIENHEEMAVRAALAMHGALAGLNEKLAAKGGVRLAIRIGVNTGLVLFGAMGGRTSGDFAAVGDAVNLAARLQAACPVGGVLVSAETARPIQAIFDFESPRQLTVKGKADPVFTYLVIGERAHRERVRGVAGLDAPTVGRDAELRALHEAFERCMAHQHWEVLAVVGEPGIGKTRLRREFAAWLATAHPWTRLLIGRCYPHTQATPYYLTGGFHEVLGLVLGVSGLHVALLGLIFYLSKRRPLQAREGAFSVGV